MAQFLAGIDTATSDDLEYNGTVVFGR